MIRRNIQFDDGTAAWLLISQVEHAGISGALTQAWHETFSDEVVEAVTHHDDGWAAWEAAPQIDAKRGCPLSFLEMSIEDALRIWDGSIAAARRIGPLAAAIVAGHFIGLASGSDQASQPLAAQWLRGMANERAAWLAEWQRAAPSHTSQLAERGQQMLLTADLLSLWLGCDGPVSSVDAGEIPNAEMKTRTVAVLGKYRFATHTKAVGRDEIIWQGSLAPWPLRVDELNLAAPGIAVPVAKYRSWQDIAAASWPIPLRWRLTRAAI